MLVIDMIIILIQSIFFMKFPEVGAKVVIAFVLFGVGFMVYWNIRGYRLEKYREAFTEIDFKLHKEKK